MVIVSQYAQDEMEYLFARAQTAPSGCLVELGVFFGASASAILAGAHDRLVVLIDPWEKHAPSWRTQNPMEAKDCVRQLVQQYSNVLVIPVFGNELYGFWRIPIGFLHVDDSHAVDTFTENLDLFAPWLVSGGALAVHDWSIMEKVWKTWSGREQYKDPVHVRDLCVWTKQ